jgi:nitronate monooxygenase/enoyl-[acyl-carrier protein] reductase II
LDEEAFAYTLEARPAVISLSLGDPGDFVKRAHDAGIKVMQQIHTVQQAQQAAERGVDVIIAQGAEGGGQGYPLGVGIMVLLPQVVDAVKPIPVVAAGGIADGRGLAAAFVLGAEGVNMGTRFVASEEASSNASWRKALIAARSEDTVRFEVWKEIAPPAKPGAYPFAPRVLRSAFVDEWQARPDEAKRQAERLRVEVKAAVRDHRLAEILPFAGQTVGMITDILPAAEIVRRIVREARQVLEGALRT